MSNYLKKYSICLALVLALIFAAQAYFGNLDKSLAWDEPSYIAGGYTYLKWGDFRINPSHPPLTQVLAALPLLFIDIQTPSKEDPSFRNAANPAVEFGYQLLYENGNDFLRIGRLARLTPLMFGTFLVLAVYLWGAALYGRAPALLAATLTAFSPNVIGYAKIVTEDIGCVTLMFSAVWMLWRSLRGRNFRNWALCGLVTGLALIAKYTALILGPIYLVLAVGFWLKNKGAFDFMELVKGGVIVVAFSLLVIGIGYNFSFDYSLYFQGLQQIYVDMSDGTKGYLFGMVTDEPLWYYYIAAFFLKVPVPILLLIAASGFYTFRGKTNPEAVFFLLVPVAAVILVSCFDPQNLGIRRILPAFPFLFLFAAGIAAGDKNLLEKVFIGCIVGWIVLEAWLIYPHHLTYFNTLAGGAKKGPYLLHNANIDQGQDLPALASWQKEYYGGRPIKLFYNGTANPIAYGVNPLQMDQKEILSPQPGIYAISTNNLVMFRILKAKKGYDVDWLTKYRPIAYAGNSIYIYQFD